MSQAILVVIRKPAPEGNSATLAKQVAAGPRRRGQGADHFSTGDGHPALYGLRRLPQEAQEGLASSKTI